MKRRKISTRIIALVLCTLMILITISPMQADEYNTQETADATARSTDSNAETNQTTGVETTEETASAEEATTETTEDAAKETGEASDAGEPAEETPDAEEPAEEAPVQKAVELKHEFTDENGSVAAAVTANIPEGTFNAETSAVSMEVTEVDTAMNDTVKALIEKSLASDKVLSNYFLYNVVFKVNGETTEPGKEINITFERKDFKIEDAKKASTFYFNDANSPAGNTEAEIIEIPQRADMIEALQAAGESTDNIEDYDLSDISLKEDGTADKIQMEGRRSTIYGCYVEDQKPEEVVTPTEPEKDETKKEDTKKEDTEKEDTKKEDTKTEEKKEESAAQTMTFENDDVTVTVTADAEGVIPKDSKLQVVPILKDEKDTKAQYKEVEEQLNKKAEDEEYDIAGFLAYDISFVDKDGKEVEPNKDLGNVKVVIDYKKDTIPEEVKTEDDAELDVTVMHLEENKKGEVKEVVDMVADEKQEATVETTDDTEVKKAEFVADSFSAFTITWTRTKDKKIYKANVEATYGYMNGDSFVAFQPQPSVSEIPIGDTSWTDLQADNLKVTIEGYKFDSIHLGNANGTEAKYLKRNTNQLKYSMNGNDNGTNWDGATLTTAGATYNIYYVYTAESTGGGESGGGEVTEPQPTVEKRAEQVDAESNKYNLELDISSSLGSKTDPAKLDVLMIVDRSGSMTTSRLTAARNAAKSLVTSLSSNTNLDVNYALVSFSAPNSFIAGTQDDARIDTTWTGEKSTINTAIDEATSEGKGGTNYQAGFYTANSVLGSVRKEAKTAVIFLTDGKPTSYIGGGTGDADSSTTYDVVNKARTEIEGMKRVNYFYSVGFGEDFNGTTSAGYNILNSLTNSGTIKSSSMHSTKSSITCKGANAATTGIKTAQNAADLKTEFDKIAAEVTHIACTNVTVTDTLSDYISTSSDTTCQLLITRKGTALVDDKVVYRSGETAWGTPETLNALTGTDDYSASIDEATTNHTALKLSSLAGTSITFNGKKVTVTYPAAYELSPDYTYTLVINTVGVSSAATDAFKTSKEYPSTGDAETGTFAGQKGFYSNVNKEAVMTYKVKETEKSANFPKPVVQLSEEEYYENSVVADKSAKVVNWDERTYDITLNASSVAKAIKNEEPVDIVLVFDRSGSMHFRSGLNYACEGTVTGVGTVTGLETDQVYYYVSNDSAAVVYRFWYSGGSWRYIDDSYWKYPSDPNNENATNDSANGGNIINDSKGKLKINNGTTCTFYTASGEHDRLYYLKEAANTFAEQLATISPDSRIGLVTFAQQAKTVLGLQDVSDGYSGFVDAVNGITTGPYTYQAGGLTEAQALLDRSGNSGRKQYVILLTDGCPTIGTYTDMENAADIIKNTKTANRTVMTVAVGLAENNANLAEAKRYLSNCASAQSGTETKYAYSADDADALPGVFQSILQSINNVAITNATVKDYIDPRFEVDLDSVRAAGGTVETDENGTCVIWTEQTLNPEVNGTPGWSKTIRVKAKADYIGGNAVTTNGAASGVTVGNTTVPFEQPTVNVKAVLDTRPYEVTIYKGDSVPTKVDEDTTIQSQMENISEWLGENGSSKYEGVDATDFTIAWYSDAACTTPVNLSEVTTDSTTKYYLKVTYDAGEPTEDSNENTTTSDGKVHHAGGENNIADSINAYTVNVISGEIQIKKELAKASTKDQTFTFGVVNTEAGSQETVVSITVKAGATSGTLSETEANKLKNLARGEYTVTEKSTNTEYKLKELVKDTPNNTKFVKAENGGSITFTLGTNEENKDVIAANDTTKGRVGAAKFTNEEAYDKEPVNFYLNLSSSIMDTSGAITTRAVKNFTKSVSGPLATLGSGLNTDLEVKLPDDHKHVTGDNDVLAVIGGESNQNASKVDGKIRELENGTTGNQTGQEALSYQIIDGNGNGAFPEDADVFAYIKANWGNSDNSVNKGNKITANGLEIDKDKLTTDNFVIRWYVFKDQKDYWHIDGILVPKAGTLTITKTFPNEAIATEMENNTEHPFGIEVTGEFLQSTSGGSTTTTITKTLNKTVTKDENGNDVVTTDYDKKVVNDDGTVTYTWGLAVFGESYTIAEKNYNPTNSDWTWTNATWKYTDAKGAVTNGNGTEPQTVTIALTATDTSAANQVFALKNFYSDKTVDLDLKKTGTGYNGALAGAKFELTKVNDQSFAKQEIEVKNGDAEIELKALKAGLYQLTETYAPTGYSLLEEAIYFKVSQGNITLTNDKGESLTTQPANWKIDGPTGTTTHFVLTIANEVLYELPNSGGIGIYWYMISGILLMLAATLILYKNKKHEGVLKK